MTSIKNIAHLGQAARLARKLADMAETLAASAHPLHKADADLLRINVLQLYEEILLLKAEDTEKSTPKENKPKGEPSTYELPETSVGNILFVTDQTENEAQAFDLPDEAQTSNFSAQEAETQPIHKQAPAKENPLRDKKPSATPIPDLFSANTLPLVDKLAAQPDNSLAARLEKRPIAELRKVIGINEKFLFINELFEGNIQLYNHAIDELDGFKSYNGAKTYLIELSVLHGWDPESPAALKLNELIDRKFENT